MHSYIEKEDVLVSVLYIYLVLFLHNMIPCEQIILEKLVYSAFSIFGKLTLASTVLSTTKPAAL